MEAYIDDMVVKSKQNKLHLGDLSRIFVVLRKHHLRLNASKCAFGVGSGKFLGYLITHWGIEVNLDKIEAIRLHSSRNPKEIQKLTRMAASLNHFISRSTERCKPFFQLLKKWKDYHWTSECEEAFVGLKEYLMKSPILSQLEKGEELYMYLVVSNHAVRAVLIRLEEDIQKPRYYVSKTLVDPETR